MFSHLRAVNLGIASSHQFKQVRVFRIHVKGLRRHAVPIPFSASRVPYLCEYQ